MNLAAIWSDQGRYGEAERVLDRTLQMSESALGRTHHQTLATLAVLLELYRQQARYEDAEPLALCLLDRQRKTLGDRAPATLETMKLLAHLAMQQHEYVRARPLLEHLLPLCGPVLEAGYPMCLVAMAEY